jgi:hypothetical protein
LSIRSNRCLQNRLDRSSANNRTERVAMRTVISFVVALTMSLFVLSSNAVLALDCSASGAPRLGSGGFGRAPAGLYEYKKWCEDCGGTFSTASGASCTPGPNWGRTSSSGSTVGSGPYRTGDWRYDTMLNSAHNLGQSIGQSIRESSARRAREEELSQQQAVEEKARYEAEQTRQKEEGYQRLTGSLRGIDSRGSVALKTGSGGETLSLKMDSTPSEIQPKSSPSTSFDGLKLKGLGNSEQAANDSSHESSEFLKGLKDASGCFSSNAFGYCSGYAQGEIRRCTEDYQKGYQKGEQQRQLSMRKAFESGRSDAIAGRVGNPNLSFNDPHAQGPCRTEWIMSYNRGYFEGVGKKEK